MPFPYLSHVQTKDGLQIKGNTLTVWLKTEALAFDKVQLRCEPDNEEYLIDMQQIGKEGRLLLWKAEFNVNQDQQVTHYLFKLLQGNQQYWLDGRGVQKRIPGREYHFKYNSVNQPPEWVSEQVFYQIFPERFCNGRPEISVKDGEYFVGGGKTAVVAKQWHEPITDKRETANCEFYGGDIAGIRSKLDYLQELGITTLYLNPLFSSPSNHKYDTTDYFSIDKHFGNNQEFAELCQEIHSRGMKVVLDAVFNHTSIEHPWFDKSGLHSNGAYHNPDSPYRDFYFFEGESQNYISWKGISTLPVLNFEHQAVKDTIYRSDDAIIRHWLRPPYNIDGWRFDVIHMLGEGEGAKNNAYYVKSFREATKQENPQAYVLGEHFFEASQWLQGDQEDGAMNYYGFAHPVRALLAKKDISYDPVSISMEEFSDWLAEARAKLPWGNQLSQLNQLDSHDTMRFLTMVDDNQQRMQLAATLLFTYPGVPCLYYGTEVGLEGGHDPDNRRPFPWNRVDNSDCLPFYKQLIHIRNNSLALQKGAFCLLDVADSYLIFSRQLADERVIVVISTEKQKLIVPVWKTGIEQGSVIELLNEKKELTINQGIVELEAGEMQATVLRVSEQG